MTDTPNFTGQEPVRTAGDTPPATPPPPPPPSVTIYLATDEYLLLAWQAQTRGLTMMSLAQSMVREALRPRAGAVQ